MPGSSKKPGVCRNCLERGLVFADGLCSECHPVIQASSSEIRDKCGGYNQPLERTDATPGSEEKMVVLEERATLGCSLHHKLDAKLCRGSDVARISTARLWAKVLKRKDFPI